MTVETIDTIFSPFSTTSELMRAAAALRDGEQLMSINQKELLMTLLKERGMKELEFGQELVINNVRLVKRVTGAVSVFLGLR